MLPLYVVLLCCLAAPYAVARHGFLKDQNEDLVEFPPKFLQTFDGAIPVGHLRPLGWQRYPTGIVEEVRQMPEPKDFYEIYVAHDKPAVFRKALQNIPAMEKWPEKNYLKKKYGKIEIDVVEKKGYKRLGLKRMKFGKFLRDYTHEDLYLSNFVPQPMMEELVLPDCLRCGFSDWMMESELWMSSGGTSSRLHSHADHDVHCLLTGRKDFIFIEHQHRHVFDYHDKSPYDGAGHSELDMDQMNMFKYRGISDVPWAWSTLRAGDCIFVPAGYLHQVRSYGVSISYTNHFAPTPELDFGGCAAGGSADGGRQTPLSDVHFLWVYQDGKLLLSDSELNATKTKHLLLKVMRNQNSLSHELFGAFYKEVMEEARDFPPVETVWSRLTAKESLDRDEVKGLSEAALSDLGFVLLTPRTQAAMRARDEL